MQIALFFYAFDCGASPVFIADRLLLCVLVATLVPHNGFLVIIFIGLLAQYHTLRSRCADSAAVVVEPDRKLIKCAAAAYFIVLAAATLIYKLNGLSLWQFFSILVYAFVIALGVLIKALGGKLSKKEKAQCG